MQLKGRILTLPRAAPIAPRAAPEQKPAGGLTTAASAGPAGESLDSSRPGSKALQSAPAPRKLARDATLIWLAIAYPLAFGTDVKPLAIGVGRQIWPQAKAAGIGRRALNDALKFRTTSPAYLEALAADAAMRFDLDGQRKESVTAEHRARPIEMKAGSRKATGS
jgi:sRNA-binding protein